MAHTKLGRCFAGLALMPGVAAVCLGCAERLLKSQVLESHFELPDVPLQPTASTLNCTSTYKSERFPYIAGEWSITASEGGCAFTSGALSSVKATADEMGVLTHRPQISYKVGPDGTLTHPCLLRLDPNGRYGSGTTCSKTQLVCLSRRNIALALRIAHGEGP